MPQLMTINPLFTNGQIVYLKTSSENPGMVTGLLLRPGNVLIYFVSFPDEVDERQCFDIELTTEKSFE